METEAQIRARCLELVNEKYPKMPKAWRAITAAKAAHRWGKDHLPAPSPEVIKASLRFGDIRRDAQAMVNARLPHVRRRERRRLAKEAARNYLKTEKETLTKGEIR